MWVNNRGKTNINMLLFTLYSYNYTSVRSLLHTICTYLLIHQETTSFYWVLLSSVQLLLCSALYTQLYCYI